jgi:glycosyltransferase involved in cell wall biosynthesis
MKILYASSFGTSGYAEAGKDYMIALHNLGHKVQWFPYYFQNTRQLHTSSRDTLVNSFIVNEDNWNKNQDAVIVHLTPDHLPDWKFNKMNDMSGKLISMTVFETSKLHHDWPGFINLADMCIVPSSWNENVFIESGIEIPIYTVPHIFMQKKNIKGKVEGIDKDFFVFYVIGQWTERKGIEDTVKAFCEEFRKDERVCLLVKTFGSGYLPEDIAELKMKIMRLMSVYKNSAKVVFMVEEVSEEKIVALHTMGDCYVSLCKSEGWGLGAFDAAGYGNPVIITGYGGQMDFLKSKINHLLHYTLVPVKGMKWIKWYNENQLWAQPDLEHAKKLMRIVFSKGKKQRKNKSQKEFIRQNFSSDIVGQLLNKCLTEEIERDNYEKASYELVQEKK